MNAATVGTLYMTLATAKMLSEALSQYIDNAVNEDERSPQDYINLAEAARLLDSANAVIAGLDARHRRNRAYDCLERE